jgi:hypothetical protein
MAMARTTEEKDLLELAQRMIRTSRHKKRQTLRCHNPLCEANITMNTKSNRQEKTATSPE